MESKQSKEAKLLYLLIEKYIFLVKHEVKSMQKLLGVEDICSWRSQNIPRKGVLNGGKIKYQFHGTGCEIVTPLYNFDFEFSIDCEIGGFDMWRIWTFLNNNEFEENFDVLRNKNKFDFFFNQLNKGNFIYQKNINDVYFINKISSEIQTKKRTKQ